MMMDKKVKGKQINLKERKVKSLCNCIAIAERRSMEKWLAAKILTARMYGSIEIASKIRFYRNYGFAKIARCSY